ncbi:hypothetical protein ACJIZ3_007131 [Penstemon smallii]|uniref:Homeobox domain-containing protein n=1 Tax=Penstemon smallii TaxID=265156 RepID=A0ABD3S9N1_9LAMI
MGRPPSNGGPSFRFNQVEVGEMETILQAHNYSVPSREILDALAQRFSSSAERSGKVEVSVKQVWNWFQNRRYALRAKASKAPARRQVNVSSMPMPMSRDDQAVVKNQAPQPQPAPSTTLVAPQVPHPLPAPSAQNAGRNASDNSQMEFEAKSARDGAWYDVESFLSHRSLETGDPEALVRFVGFGPEEDEWVNILRHVRQRSLPCESSECVVVLPKDLILCFQEGKDQALYFDAHVLDAQRRRHDVRGCRCRFLVRYDHDQSEEIVPLKKVCRRPETDYRLQQLHSGAVNVNPEKTSPDPQKKLKPVERIDAGAPTTPVTTTNVPGQ